MKKGLLSIIVLSAFFLAGCQLLTSLLGAIGGLAPAISVSAPSTTIKAGEILTIAADVSHQDMAGVTIAWQVDGQTQAGATGSSFAFSATPDVDTVYTITVTATYNSLEASASLKVTVLSALFNPLPGRWTMEAGSISLSYWFYEDLGAHRESSFGDSSAGFYTFTATMLDFHFIGSSLDESYAYRISSGILTLSTPDGEVAAVLTKQPSLDMPVNSPPIVSIADGKRALPYGKKETLVAAVTDADAQDTALYEWYVDGLRVSGEESSSFDFIEMPEVAHDYGVKVIVSDGRNLATASVVISVSGPPEAPKASISSPYSGATNRSPIDLTIQFTEEVEPPSPSSILLSGAGLDSLVEGADPSIWELSITPSGEGLIGVTVPAGVTRTLVLAKANLASATYYLTYDRTPPTIALSSSASPKVYDNSLIPVSGSDLHQPRASLDNLSWTSLVPMTATYGDLPGFTSLPFNQDFTLYLRDTDLAGNLGSSTASVFKDSDGSSSVIITLNTPTDAALTFGNFDSTISRAGNESLSVSVLLPGASSFAWYLDGVLAGNSTSIGISSLSNEPGPYVLSLLVLKDGKPYSAELHFNVTN